MNSINFLKRALSDYRIGAITKSSRFVVRNVIKNIPKGARYIVEYGPGDGVTTKDILKVLPEDGKLVVIERNKHFCEHLKEIKDKRLIVVNDTIEEISLKDFTHKHSLPKVDAVVSSVPLTIFKPASREQVVKSTADGLSDGGVFIVYQYSLLLKPLLKKYFRKFSYKIEFRNLPPYFIMVGKK